MMKNKTCLLFSILVSVPALCMAHEVAGDQGFLSGLLHPVFGLDHLLAMVCVGLLSVQLGGKKMWKVPAAFLTAMLAGGALGMLGVPLFSVELGIVLSVPVLGVALAADKRLSVPAAMALAGFFAVFHGHAHGTEMPALAQPVLYAAGFLAGTAGIHLVGALMGWIAVGFRQGPQTLRYVGVGIAGAGLHMLLG